MVKKLKVEDIPEGFNYAAVDSDGWAYAYVEKPELLEDSFHGDYDPSKKSYYIGMGYDTSNWQNSLVSRETDERPQFKTELNWAHIPEVFNYAAVDKDGSAWAFQQKPVLNEQYENWATDIPEYLFQIGQGFDSTDWQNSLVSKNEVAKPKKLTAADIPDGFSYAAVNENGSGYAFKTRPLLSGLFWAGGCELDSYEFLGGFDSGNWQNSLVSRESQETFKVPLLTVEELMEVVQEFQKHKSLSIECMKSELETAYKETANKLSYSEIDPYFLEQMARRMQKGKEKYGPNNWKKLSDINELLDAAQRHLLELRKMVQEDFEPLPGQESEAQHCAALACNAMFIHYHLNPNT